MTITNRSIRVRQEKETEAYSVFLSLFMPEYANQIEKMLSDKGVVQPYEKYRYMIDNIGKEFLLRAEGVIDGEKVMWHPHPEGLDLHIRKYGMKSPSSIIVYRFIPIDKPVVFHPLKRK